MMALFHELEEDVGLLGFYIDVPELIDRQDIHVRQRFQQSACRSIGERGIHFIEQILSLDEEGPIAILHSFSRQTDYQPSFADAGFADEDYVLRLGDELEFGERADLAFLDAFLQL